MTGFFRLDPNGKFVEQTREVGLASGGRGLGVLAADIDRDGDTDLYVANDEAANFMYLNDGKGRLAESGIQLGCAVDQNGTVQGSMGVAIGDYQGTRKQIYSSQTSPMNSALCMLSGVERVFDSQRYKLASGCWERSKSAGEQFFKTLIATAMTTSWSLAVT